MLEFAGLVISGFSLLHELGKTYHDLREWKEEDVEIDFDWLPLAFQKGLLDGGPDDYAWVRLRSVPTKELAGTHKAVIAYNAEKRIRYRVVQGRPDDRLVLIKKTPA